jgi:thymidine kinase
VSKNIHKKTKKMTGKLTLVIGPMFAGKTTELQRRVKREIHACRRVCIIRYGKDDRYSKTLLATHDQSHMRPTFSVEKLAEVGDKWEEYDTVAVDEGQFFPDLVEFCTQVTDAGKSVIVVGLDGDFLRRPFGKICELVPMAEEVVKITAVCMACHEKDAHFTRRTVQSNETELIGGADMYIAVCRDCYNHPAPPTPGRVNRYRQNVKEVERMCLRGLRQSAELKQGAISESKDTNATDARVEPSEQQQPENIVIPNGVNNTASGLPREGGLRRSRSQNVQQQQQQPVVAVKPNSQTEVKETEVSNMSVPELSVGSPHLPPFSPQK